MTVTPASIAEMQEAVRSAARVRIAGGGTKSDASPGAAVVLRTSASSGILEYSPDECVLTARAGTRIAEIETLLQAHGQYLPFDPPFAAEGATVGGVIASGVSGPRRYRYGGVRDFLIGVRVVDGNGRLIRSGGRVVKNAAGFLLHHGVVGSRGRFGVIVEATFKVFPQPEARRTLTLDCGSVAAARDVARRIETMGRDLEAIDFDDRGTLWVDLAGSRAAIDARVAALAGRLSAAGVPMPVTTEATPDRRWRTAGRNDGLDHAATSWVKVAGAADRWTAMAACTRGAYFLCAGSVAWLFTTDLDALSRVLAAQSLTGQVFRGPGAGALVGDWPLNVFEERVRRVLDPRNCFGAAPDSAR